MMPLWDFFSNSNRYQNRSYESFAFRFCMIGLLNCSLGGILYLSGDGLGDGFEMNDTIF